MEAEGCKDPLKRLVLFRSLLKGKAQAAWDTVVEKDPGKAYDHYMSLLIKDFDIDVKRRLLTKFLLLSPKDCNSFQDYKDLLCRLSLKLSRIAPHWKLGDQHWVDIVSALAVSIYQASLVRQLGSEARTRQCCLDEWCVVWRKNAKLD